jgi:hypothetical protein
MQAKSERIDFGAKGLRPTSTGSLISGGAVSMKLAGGDGVGSDGVCGLRSAGHSYIIRPRSVAFFDFTGLKRRRQFRRRLD